VITRLELTHFKCFERLRLPLAPLTLLSGCNASGKSSVLQALVLLHQTMRDHEWSPRLMLNGIDIRMGTVKDVVDKVHGRRSFELGVREDDFACDWQFSGERDDMSMALDGVAAGDTSWSPKGALRYLLPRRAPDPALQLAARLRDLTYITAERVGPREVYPLEDRQTSSVVGPAGEHAVSVLYWGRDEKVMPGLRLESVTPTRLRQVGGRMQRFFPGCSLELQQVPQANALTLGLRTSEDTDYHRPIHVGFGLTQVLPIVIAAMSASEGDLMLIENPEVHLHPAGQAQMGLFLAEAAAAGLQVLLETHSDHVLNGIRRSVKVGLLSPDQTAFHFFQPRGGEGAQVLSPQIDRRGNLDFWPDGFFDQFDKDTNYFAGWEH
jgi:predicted ATPase